MAMDEAQPWHALWPEYINSCSITVEAISSSQPIDHWQNQAASLIGRSVGAADVLCRERPEHLDLQKSNLLLLLPEFFNDDPGRPCCRPRSYQDEVRIFTIVTLQDPIPPAEDLIEFRIGLLCHLYRRFNSLVLVIAKMKE